MARSAKRKLEVITPRSARGSTARPIRIVIVDDMPIFRDGLRLLLRTDTNLQIVGDTCPGSAATALVRELQPDVLLLGCISPGGQPLEMLKGLSADNVGVRTILLVKSIATPEITDALQFGARGVVARDSPAELLFKSIDAVMAGDYWIGHERVAGNIAAMIRRLARAQNHSQRFGLTRRELEIVRRVVNGDTNHEIAMHLGIAENTVKRHIMNIFNKVGASNRVELALFVAYHRLLDDI